MWNALTTEARRERAENTANFMAGRKGESGLEERTMGKKRGRRWYLYESGAKQAVPFLLITHGMTCFGPRMKIPLRP